MLLNVEGRMSQYREQQGMNDQGNRVSALNFICALFLACCGAASAQTNVNTSRKPALWAVYYAWYETAPGPRNMWTVWNGDKTTNSVAKPRSKAQPLIGYYDSDDQAVVRWHIKLAKAAGIEAFLVSWWGAGSLSGVSFEKVILPLAAEEGFKVAMCSELAQFHHDVDILAKQMAEVLQRTKDQPGYLRVDGKPAVYLYQVPYAPKLTPATLTKLCHGIEQKTGPLYWIMDKIVNDGKGSYCMPAEWLGLPGIAMYGFYGTFSIKRMWKYDEIATHYSVLAKQAHAAGKKIFLPAHPGHDNSGFRPDDYFVMPRDEGATLKGYLRAIVDAGADAVLVTSFNEWQETTIVEPSSSWHDPYLYLKILAEWEGIKFIPPPLPERKR
jgi:hypothetical protein